MYQARLCTAIALASATFAGTPLTVSAAEATLEEIIVTAQRREQSLKEVPISVTTLSGERLSNIFAGSEDIRALATRVPSLYAESSNGRVAPRFYIRGLGNTDFDLAASQPVLVVHDEVVQENVVLKSYPLFDVERVEVLKVPQGSLFGRNTPAGIVKIDTVKPSHENSGYASASYGTLDNVNFEGAFGGGLVDDVLAARVSVLYQDRGDWIDNDFTGENDAYGGFDEFAWRTQALWTPTDRLSVLGNLHGRAYEGTAALFRANIIGPGNDSLNANFDRDSVFFDAGAGNPQEYDAFGWNLRADYSLTDTLTLTSITASEEADGFSRGDIDGGAIDPSLPGGTAPGFIPFGSDTQDGIDDLEQYTQELRLAHAGDRLDWQVGFFYFDSELQITTNPFFAPPTTLEHENESWAFFGQASIQATDRLEITAGARFTDDEKDLTALAANLPVAPVNVDDSDLSWDLAATYRLNDDVNVYGRLARGFRAPTIQGRDVAFFGAPSTADSETITSVEAGFKAELLDQRVRWNLTAFYYEIEDQQLSAIGGGGNLIQLVNADEGVGQGFETDVEWLVNEYVSFTLGYSYNDTELKDGARRVAVCAQCTVADPIDPANGTAIVDGNPFPHAPEDILYLTTSGAIPLAELGGEVFFAADYAYQGETEFFLYDSAEFQSDGNFELGARLGYRPQDGNWEVSLFGRNITDEENLKGGIDFNNNTGFVNEPRIVGLNLRVGLGG